MGIENEPDEAGGEVEGIDLHAAAERWTKEFQAARRDKAFEKWNRTAKDIPAEFRNERLDENGPRTALPIFTSNMITQRAMMYGNPPRAVVTRRFADANDDVARVAGEILERLINTDIERRSDGTAVAFRDALSDRGLPGLGTTRARYVMEEGVGPDGQPIKVSEDVEIDYVHWTDQLWSPCRVWSEARWWGHSAKMSRAELRKKFGDAEGDLVPLSSGKDKRATEQTNGDEPWARADVWEVWDKEHEEVHWFVEGMDHVLDAKRDPYTLEAFFPCPEPMVANPTTDAFVPRPDYALNQDLYRQINVLADRISLLEESISASGLYNKEAGQEIEKLLTGGQNKLYPVSNWAMLAESGGLKGNIDWLPLEAIVGALSVLTDRLVSKIDLLYQLEGMSDIMRGMATQSGATATEQRAKVRFGSVRMQQRQQEFARFVSDQLRIRAELIVKFFDPQTILERCNCAYTADRDIAPKAVEFLKANPWMFRLEVKPEAIAMTDFSALKDEKTELLTAIGGFISLMGPVVQQMPGSLPHMLQLLQASLSGLRGASSMEGILDQAIAQAEQAASAPAAAAPPDPKVEAEKIKAQTEQMKAQANVQKINMELEADMVRTQADVEADRQREVNQAESNTREHVGKLMATRALAPPKPTPGNGGAP